MKEVQSCSNCKFYYELCCCYNPPTIFRYSNVNGYVGVWPMIHEGDYNWCGKWEPTVGRSVVDFSHPSQTTDDTSVDEQELR